MTLRGTSSIVWLLALAACDATTPEPATPVIVAPAPETPRAAAVPARPEPVKDIGAVEVDPRAWRRQAALDLLSDGRSAAALPIVATDAGHAFDARLADRLTPRIRINGFPVVRQAKHTVTGPGDKDIIRRIVRAHINEIRYCYNLGLVVDPQLKGRVEVDFEIADDGRVVASEIRKSTLENSATEDCIAAAVLRWKFGKAASAVKVSYPFEFAPG